MGKTKFKWNMGAFQDLRRLPGVVSELNSRAQAVADAAGVGYVANDYDGRTRHRSGVITATPKAIRDNAKNNTLIKSLDAARG